jgi:predicted metalloprotease with PDZ domain
MKALTVYSGGAAERAGLAAGDQVVALDGLKATTESLRALLERRAPGDALRVHAFRRDELVELDVVLAEPSLDTCYLALIDSPTDEVRIRRDAWLAP